MDIFDVCILHVNLKIKLKYWNWAQTNDDCYIFCLLYNLSWSSDRGALFELYNIRRRAVCLKFMEQMLARLFLLEREPPPLFCL